MAPLISEGLAGPDDPMFSEGFSIGTVRRIRLSEEEAPANADAGTPEKENKPEDPPSPCQ